ncbi:hypothetical protein [Christiangramia portivictoriae]|uniref:hypothetical protein n=1 Tax=Christiangramia portivictoriae TaxID=326069 RepID=UPI0004212B5C|nr:hypothetical protein [Christiangramia portivictoriae]
MIPTEDGKQLYNFVLDAVKKLEKAEQHFKKTSKEAVAAINIGMCTETFQAILEPEIPALEFNLMAKFGEHQAQIKDLHNEILDLVITPINGKKNLLPLLMHLRKNILCWSLGKKPIYPK